MQIISYSINIFKIPERALFKPYVWYCLFTFFLVFASSYFAWPLLFSKNETFCSRACIYSYSYKSTELLCKYRTEKLICTQFKRPWLFSNDSVISLSAQYFCMSSQSTTFSLFAIITLYLSNSWMCQQPLSEWSNLFWSQWFWLCLSLSCWLWGIQLWKWYIFILSCACPILHVVNT